MIKIFDSLFFNSLIGLGIILIITLENIILAKKKTIPVAILDQLFFSFISLLFGWPCIIYSILGLALVGFIRYRNKYIVEGSSLDFSGRIFSLAAPFNKRQKPKKGEIIVGNILPINKYELKDNLRPIKLNDIILSGSALVTGSTGSGKTTTMKSIMKQAIADGKPVVFFDYKGEEEILNELESYANQKNIPYYEFSTRRCTFSYDPLINLNETGKVEALMNTRRWDAGGADEHYKTSTQLAIQNIVHKYDKYRKQTEDTRNYLIGLRDFTYSYKPEQNERDGFNTLLKQLEILLSSKAKELFVNDYGKEKFTFENNNSQFVICFSFISANKALANSLSSFIFQDIMDRGTRHQYDPKLMICIDEFGTLESSTLIKDILEKGRSGGCQTIFSILDINQIAMNAGEYFVNAILGTINSFIIHAGATQKTADLLAGVQKYDNKGYSIMDLRKPYNGKPPTALFISKYPLLSKKGNQEIYRIIPYTFKDKKKVELKENIKSTKILLNGQELLEIKNNKTAPQASINNYEIKEKEQHYFNPSEEILKPTVVDNIDEFL